MLDFCPTIPFQRIPRNSKAIPIRKPETKSAKEPDQHPAQQKPTGIPSAVPAANPPAASTTGKGQDAEHVFQTVVDLSANAAEQPAALKITSSWGHEAIAE